MTKKTLFWFRQDLRLYDNPGFYEACKRGKVLAVYIMEEKALPPGAASCWWLHHSLQALDKKLNHKLNLYRGSALKILLKLIHEHQITQVNWNICYEPEQLKNDKIIKNALCKEGIKYKEFNASLLWEPQSITKKNGYPYQVFTPYYRNGCLNAFPPRVPIPCPEPLHLLEDSSHALPVEHLELLPSTPWYPKLETYWKVGEDNALKCFYHFLENGLTHYKSLRDFPYESHTSHLSPHLHFGEISPHTIWHTLRNEINPQVPLEDIDIFLKELGWREFSYYLLYHFPQLPYQNFNTKFNQFPWEKNYDFLAAWQKGQTGYPLIDAGMRELWQTGYMHNRIRMVTASFLVKNLLWHWEAGAAWFWDCLVDADLANNSASWQWVAGSGADAAPYFRIFNPVTQGEKFDAQGSYTLQFVPELKKMPLSYLFKPWKASPEILKKAGVELGKTYPKPIVELTESRKKALEAYAYCR